MRKQKKQLKNKQKIRSELLILLVYFLVSLITIIIHQSSYSFFSMVIPLGLFIIYYFSLINSKFTKTENISSIIFLMILSLGPFGIYDFSFFGVLGDVYLHLLAGFFCTMWINNYLVAKQVKNNKFYTFLIMIFFAVIVEVYEYFSTLLFKPSSLNNDYLLDTLNDFVNDFIGIMLGLIKK